MKCVLLQAPGEILEGSAELNELGYQAASYPVSQKVENCWIRVARSLRNFSGCIRRLATNPMYVCCVSRLPT